MRKLFHILLIGASSRKKKNELTIYLILEWQIALNYLSLTHPRDLCAGTIGREIKGKDSKIIG